MSLCSKKLYGKIIDINNINENLTKILFELYFNYFENVKYDVFVDHISHKDKVILLYECGSENIRGFSTLKKTRIFVDGKYVSAIFSGDTIIDHRFWGELELVKSFTYYAGQVAKDLPPEEKLYWFLISKGYKTYRFLPVFMEVYYPTYKEKMPLEMKNILDALAYELYPDEYDATKNLLTFNNKIGNLRQGVGEITSKRLSDPDIAFFSHVNPDHMKGVELTCLTELSAANFRGDAQKESTVGVAKKYFNKGFNGEPFNEVSLFI